jgi:hypothetical protein
MWGSSTASWAGLTPGAERVGRPASVAHAAAYAGFADRLGGLLIDSIVVWLAQLPVVIVMSILLWIVTEVTGSRRCRLDPDSSVGLYDQLDACASRGSWIFLALSALYIAALIWVWWRIVPGRMVRRGASVGMEMAHLEIDRAGTETGIEAGVGRLQALWRALLAGFLPLVLAAAPFLVALSLAGSEPDLSDFLGVGVLALLLVSALAYVLPWAWSLWDRRHQTLYDKFSGAVVVGPSGSYEEWSIAALVCGIASMFGVVILAPLAIVFGNMSMSRIRNDPLPLKGRGAARAGQVLGWIVLLVVLVVAAIWLIATQPWS